MGLGTYLGSKSEKELYESERRREIWEMDNMPDIERQEIRDIYAAKGFSGKLLEDVVAQITGDRDVWLETMMKDELGFASQPPRPGINGVVMAISFVAGSAIPTAPYLFENTEVFEMGPLGSVPALFVFSFALSGAGLLLAGGIKTKFTKKNILFSALETLAVGALAAVGSYGIGVLLT